MKRQAEFLGLLLGLTILAAAQETRASLSGIVSGYLRLRRAGNRPATDQHGNRRAS